MPKVMKVIQVQEVRGIGTHDDPQRVATVYYTLDGRWLAEVDPGARGITMEWPAMAHDPALEGKERT